MASTTTATASLAVTGIAAISSATLTKQFNAAGDSDVLADTQDIPTGSTAVTYAGVPVTPEYLLIKNLDTTNFVEFGFANPVVPGASTIKLKAGEIALLPNPSATLYGIANVATVKIQKWAVEV